MDNAANAEKHRLDDVTVTGRGATTVQFTSSSGTVTEDETSTNLGVEIANPPGAQVTADVAFDGNQSSATTSDIGNYSTTTVTFPSSASDGDVETVDVSLSSDGAEGTEGATFVLQNPSGDAIVGSTSQFDLTIEDAVSDHNGDVMITEIMPDPEAVSDSDGEYIEIYNATNSDINVNDWTLDVDGDTDDMPSMTIPARGHMLLCENPDATENGGMQTCDMDYVNGISLNNGGSTILLMENGSTVDEVTYTDSTPWPAPSGASLVFTGTAKNDQGENWTSSSRRARGFALDRSGDKGSPGRAGADQNVQPSSEITGSAGWRLLSAPIAQVNPDTLAESNLVQGVPGQYPGADANLYQWPGGETSSVNWSPPSSSTTDLTSGARGYLWYVFGSAETAETNPPPFTLSLPGVPRTSNVDATGLGTGFYLLGNPYSQSYDLSDLDLAGKGFSTTVQIWDPSAGSYVDVIQASDASDLIAPYQGFFVERSNGTSSETLTFTPNGRRADPASLKRGNEGPIRVGFEVTGYASDSLVTRDQALTLQAHSEATLEWDVYDASKLTPLTDRYVTAEFVSSRNGEDVAQAVASIPAPLSRDSVTLPVRMTKKNTEIVDSVAFRWPAWDRVPDDWALLFRDTAADSTVNLRDASEYTFELDGSKTSSAAGTRPDVDLEAERVPTPLPKSVSLKSSSGPARFKLTVTESNIPVELTGLEATTSGRHATLRWSTASETSNAGFSVEHRAGESDDFDALSFVEGAGTTGRRQNYTYRTDRLEPGRHVFRLRQIDVDGTSNLSETVSVVIRLDGVARVTVGPTLVRNQTTVHLRVRQTQDVRLSLYDALGRRVRTLYQGPVKARQRNRYRIDATSLASGPYFLRATGAHFERTRRFVVVR